MVDHGRIRTDGGRAEGIIAGLPDSLAVLVKQGLAGPQVVVGEIICGTAFHQGQRFVIKVDVFPQNRSISRAFGDQPSVPVVKKDRGRTAGGLDDALLQGVIRILPQGSPGVRDLSQTAEGILG